MTKELARKFLLDLAESIDSADRIKKGQSGEGGLVIEVSDVLASDICATLREVESVID